jgi:hypothetical protein
LICLIKGRIGEMPKTVMQIHGYAHLNNNFLGMWCAGKNSHNKQ